MISDGHSIVVRRTLPGLLLSAIEWVEAGVGALFCAVVSLIVPCICLMGVIEGKGWRLDRQLAVGGLTVSGVVEGYCIFLVWGGFRSDRREPLGLLAARRQFRLPWPLRPVAAAWWLAHFLVGAGFAFILSLAGHSGSGTIRHRAGVLALATAFAFAFAYAANIYLMLAVSALTRRERIVRAAWHARLVVDVAVAAGAAVAAMFVKG